MRHIRNAAILFLILVSAGCTAKPKEIELTPENISRVDAAKLTKVYVLSHSSKRTGLPYGYYYKFDDVSKGYSFLRWIMDAKQTEFDRERLHQKLRVKNTTTVRIYFETKEAVYNTLIGWDDRCVYGYWWESPDLYRVFRGWGFFEDLAKADPNWPPPIWNRVSAQFDPNLAMFRAPWGDSPLMRDQFALRLKTKTELARDAFLRLDISRATNMCVVSPQQDGGAGVYWIDANTVLDHIRDARQIEFNTARTGKMLYFVVDKTLYRTGIDWDDEMVYGDWWESAELMNDLRQWGLFEGLPEGQLVPTMTDKPKVRR